MKLIVGLGNPGLKYKNSRHNFGFLVIEKLAKKLGIKFNKKEHNGLIGEGKVNQEKILLLKPLTYMNLSGLSVGALVKKKDIPLQDLLVICDDINLKLGALRLRSQGSHGGHNGLKSIIKEISSSNFSRLRLGIGTGTKESFLSDFVLAPFSKSDKKIAGPVIDLAGKACLDWIALGPEAAMNKFNGAQKIE